MKEKMVVLADDGVTSYTTSMHVIDRWGWQASRRIPVSRVPPADWTSWSQPSLKSIFASTCRATDCYAVTLVSVLSSRPKTIQRCISSIKKTGKRLLLPAVSIYTGNLLPASLAASSHPADAGAHRWSLHALDDWPVRTSQVLTADDEQCNWLSTLAMSTIGLYIRELKLVTEMAIQSGLTLPYNNRNFNTAIFIIIQYFKLISII
jgi:hypothetical protein